MYPPHGACWLWDPAMVWFHAGSDLAIFVAYWMIPWLMLLIARVSRSTRSPIVFPRLRLWWMAFILCCGLTHLGEAILVWRGGAWFWAVGAMKAITAAVSIGAFIATWRRRRRLMILADALATAAREAQE